MRRCLRVLLATVPATAMFGAPAGADSITVDFTATIDFVGSEVASGFTIGDPISGSITIDAATIDSAADPTFGSYPGAITTLSFNVGGYLVGATSGQVSVGDGATDQFTALANAVTGASVAGLAPLLAQINLLDFDGLAITGDAIPGTLLLADFADDFALASIEFDGGGSTRRVSGPLTSLSVVVVPEPGTSSLLGLGLLAVAARRRRLPRVPPRPGRR